MLVTFQNADLAALYHGTASGSFASSSVLTTFRTGDSNLADDISSLDARISSFESVLIGTIANGKTSGDYPYDRASLKREFLDEVLALLLQRSVTASGAIKTDSYAAANALGIADSGAVRDHLGNIVFHLRPNFKGDPQVVLAKTEATGWGNFDGLNTSVPLANDPRLSLLSNEGKAIFKSYATLIDAVFAEGDKLGSNPARDVQLVSAIQPLTVGSVTYNRVAQVAGVKTVVVNENGTTRTTQVPTYNSYLITADAPTLSVIKDASGQVLFRGPATSSAPRLPLDPIKGTATGTPDEFTVSIDGITLFVTATKTGSTFRESTAQPAQPAEPTTAILLNVPDRGNEFPGVRIAANHRVTASNGVTYLIGASNEGDVYVTSLSPARSAPVGTTASVTALEYLLFYNDARIKILRGQLAYREAIVREIQDDLKRANQALADLEIQSGAVTARDNEGQPTEQTSAETLKMTLFNATASGPGNPLFNAAGNDSYHKAEEWQANRTNLKNYIDRRSAEAQEATLDFQNVLNRFNNAFEVMAKLQEKLDTLLKGQLRNLG